MVDCLVNDLARRPSDGVHRRDNVDWCGNGMGAADGTLWCIVIRHPWVAERGALDPCKVRFE